MGFSITGVLIAVFIFLPILAFGFAALRGKSISLGIAVILLAIGHFVNSWHTYKLIR